MEWHRDLQKEQSDVSSLSTVSHNKGGPEEASGSLTAGYLGEGAGPVTVWKP